MIDIRTGKELTRGNFLKGGLAAILASGVAPSLVGSANATVGRGMMRGVGARQAAMFGGKSIPFIRRVSYIECTTGQYIVTNKSLFDGDVNLKFSLTSLGGDKAHFGYYVYGNWKGSAVSGLLTAFGIRQYQNKFRIANITNRYLLTNIDVDYDQHTLTTSNREIYFDGNTLNVYGGVTTHNEDVVDTLYLGAFSSNGIVQTNSGWMRIYSFSVSNEMNMIPVVAMFDGLEEGCMYDCANPTGGPLGNGLYRNAGTGSFSWGELP